MAHRTNRGDPVDMEALRLKNEEVRAVGNMNVNARGDVIDSGSKVVSERAKQTNTHYRKQTSGTVRDMPVMSSKEAAIKHAEKFDGVPAEAIVGLDEELVQEVTQGDMDAVIEEIEEKSGGLAAAIAAAKEVKQEQLKTQEEEERSIEGVKKI